MAQEEPTVLDGDEDAAWRERETLRQATWGHVAPFVFWIACIFLIGQFAIDSDDVIRAWVYAAQTVLGAGLFVYYAPWRYYSPLQWRNLPLALGVGVAVFVVWVLPEAGWVGERAPGFRAFYLQFGIFPPWKVAEVPESSAYAPAVCGWTLTLFRLAGSAFVIAVIEEFFWRGWLYRWLLGRNFMKVDLGRWDTSMVLAVSLVFALEHAQWAVGFLAGLAYLWLMIRTRDLWATALAHVLTNLLLGLYVLYYGRYEFW
jgi:uncharacterized protein